jgi:GNAT superfamily N-acetyltransferase
MIEFRIEKNLTPSLQSSVLQLMAQLSSKPVLKEDLEATVRDSNCELITAVKQNRVIGMVTVCYSNFPSGPQAKLGDLVVNAAERGEGVGRELVERAVERARTAGAATINLHSSPKRKAANRLYASIGFELLHTNLYQLSLNRRSR